MCDNTANLNLYPEYHDSNWEDGYYSFYLGMLVLRNPLSPETSTAFLQGLLYASYRFELLETPEFINDILEQRANGVCNHDALRGIL